MSREDSLSQQLMEVGAIDAAGQFKTSIEFTSNPVLDRVWIPHVDRSKRGTCISTDILIASSMIEILGSRAAYISWVRRAADYIMEKSREEGLGGSAGLSRLVQREAVAFIKDRAYLKARQLAEQKWEEPVHAE